MKFVAKTKRYQYRQVKLKSKIMSGTEMSLLRNIYVLRNVIQTSEG